MDGGPLDAGFQPAFLQCRGEAAQAAANSPAPVIPNMYAVMAAQQQRNETLALVMTGCMSKRGYVLVEARH
jgi:hypothetical protein